jgi:hypothetical protein
VTYQAAAAALALASEIAVVAAYLALRAAAEFIDVAAEAVGTFNVRAVALGDLAIVPGWFSFLDAEELAVWESQHVTASARIPASIAVTKTDRVGVINPSDPALEGPWQISTIRYNGVHLRLMLHR